MKRTFALILLLTALAAHSFADGKMFSGDNVPPKIPYQRALILFDEGTETLVLQSKYEIPKANKTASLGWVVPLPSPPEVASMPARNASQLFMSLSRTSRPKVTRIASYAASVLSIVLIGFSLIAYLLCLTSFIIPTPQGFKSNRRRLADGATWALLIGFFLLIVIPSLLAPRRSAGVDIISEHRVGIYDVSVVQSDDSKELVSWLNQHGFTFDDKDRTAFDTHLSNGWCFVVATLNPSAEEEGHEFSSEGLAPPLILRFPHETPIYPLALTGTGGFDTEILIYLASSNKMTCNDRLTLRFAGKMNQAPRYTLITRVDPTDFFDPTLLEAHNYPYLCKFKDTLTPEQMSTDIIFTQAPDNEPYQERITKW